MGRHCLMWLYLLFTQQCCYQVVVWVLVGVYYLCRLSLSFVADLLFTQQCLY
jgi:hypothetical protein